MVLSEKKAGFDPRCHLQARSTVPAHSAVNNSAMNCAMKSAVKNSDTLCNLQ